MADAIQVQKITIKCDSCDFQVEGSLEDWHNKPCPKCGAENIIDDKDMENFRGVIGMVGLVNRLIGDIEDGHRATIEVDSAAMKLT